MVGAPPAADKVTHYADMFSAMATEARLRIMQLLLKAHPDGLVVNEIQAELGIPGSTLSHHLDKLKNEDLVKVARESTFLRYTANTRSIAACDKNLSSFARLGGPEGRPYTRWAIL